MRTKLAVAMALALVATAVGMVVAPAAVAGHKDCHEDFEIDSDRQTRTLDVGESEVGHSAVSAPLDETLNVTLETDDDKLEFTIREKDGNNCIEPADLSSDCQGTVELTTEGSSTTDSKECTLPAPTSGTRDFYITFENVGNSSLMYSVESA